MFRTTKRLLNLLLIALFLSLGWGISPKSPAVARSNPKPGFSSAYELIDAVNTLRASRGLSAYSINSILMSVAQAHSDYQASIGSVTHYGPGGIRPFQRALNAGYSVGGDLSLGGFYSENIMGGTGLTAQSVVNAWTGDDPHLNTMLSTNLREVGAGVSCSGDFCYYTLDAAQPGDAPVAYTPPVGVTFVGPGTIVPTRGIIIPSTPAADGSIKHTVMEGDTLFELSLVYKVSVDDLKRLNRLTTNLIYPGNVLIIRPAGKPVTATVTETGTPAPTFTPFVFWTVTSSPTSTATPIPLAPVAGGSGMVVVGVIIVAALVLAGVFTASGTKKR